MDFLLSYAVPMLWGIVLLVSWIGWGDSLRQAIGMKRREADWALRAGWGISIVLAIGGFLQFCRLCNELALDILIIVGVWGWCRQPLLWPRLKNGLRRHARILGQLFARRTQSAVTPPLLKNRPPSRPSPKAAILAQYLPGILLIFIYLLSVRAFYLNDWDDYPAYLPFAKNLLQTGVIDQPFSLRRVLTFGGQQTLDAMTLIGGTFRNIDILELGLCRIIFVGLVAGLVRHRGRFQRILAGLFLAGVALVPRGHLPTENIHSEMTGLILFLTLLRTLQLSGKRTWDIAAMAAIVGAAAASMRATYVPAAVLMIGFYYLGRMIFDRTRWRTHAACLMVAAVTFGIFLLPWSLTLYQTSGTLLNPVWPGNQRPEYNFLAAPLSILQTANWVTGFVYWPMNDYVPMGLVMCAPLALVFFRRFRRTELPLALAASITAVMILLAFTNAWYDTIYRYVFPVMFGITIAIVYRALLRPETRTQRRIAIVMAVLLAIAHVPLGLYWLVWDRNHVPDWRVPITTVEAAAPAYQDAQNSIPAGARILVVTSYPIHFDFRRNPILLADVPGGASPPPGMPIKEGGAAIKKYLKDQGINYIIYMHAEDIDNMYSRRFWFDRRDGNKPATPDIKYSLPFNLAFIADLDELGATEKILSRGSTLTVLHLQ